MKLFGDKSIKVGDIDLIRLIDYISSLYRTEHHLTGDESKRIVKELVSIIQEVKPELQWYVKEKLVKIKI